jgi:uncharacterized protein (TIGR03032 family)
VGQKEYALAAITKEGEPAGIIYFVHLVDDVHSITVINDTILVTDTGHDKLLRIMIDDLWTNYHYNQVWLPGQIINNVDHRHINSVAVNQNHVYLSMFGSPVEGPGWSKGMDGKIINASTEETLCHGLQHPHTVHFVDDELYWLESMTGIVYHLRNGSPEVFSEAPGYLRGMAHDDRYLYVGGSASRKVSKSQGTVNAPQPLEKYQSWIHAIDRNSGQIVYSKNMTLLGSEIYDLHIANDVTFPKRSMPAEIERYLHSTR